MTEWTHVPEARVVEVGEVGNLTDADLAAMDADHLMRVKIAKEEALRLITAQLKAARREKARTGIGWDPQWFRAAMNAEAMYGHQVRLIEAEYTRRRGGTKSDRKAALQREFMNVAHEKLSPKVFEQWRDEAARRLKLQGFEIKTAPPGTHVAPATESESTGEKP